MPLADSCDLLLLVAPVLFRRVMVQHIVGARAEEQSHDAFAPPQTKRQQNDHRDQRQGHGRHVLGVGASAGGNICEKSCVAVGENWLFGVKRNRNLKRNIERV